MSAFAYPHGGSSETAGTSWWYTLLGSVGGIVLGILLIAQPIASALALLTIIALFWVAGGVVGAAVALWQHETGWGWRLIGSLIGVVAGLFVLAHPLFITAVAVETLYVMLGISAFVAGMTGLFSSRSLGSVVLSVAAIAIGAMLLFEPLHLTRVVLLAQWIGLSAIVGGILAAAAAYQGRHATSAH